MKTNQRRVNLAVGAIAGGLLAVAFLPTAVAFADDYDLAPDTSTFVPTQVEGYPPLINEVTGTEQWGPVDLTSNLPLGPTIDGVDTETTIGSFTNDDFLLTGVGLELTYQGNTVVFPNEMQIDLANFGGGFGNEWIDIPSGADAGTADLLITPFGDFPLLGSSFFSELATVLAGF
jgi:hypothetical protein